MEELLGKRPTRLPLKAAKLIRVWKENEQAQTRICQLLALDTLPKRASEQIPTLKQRISAFDADNSLVQLVASGLNQLDAADNAKPEPQPHAENPRRLRQKLLETVFLPGEEEVVWGSDASIHGLDSLSAVEYSRWGDVGAVLSVLKGEGGQTQETASASQEKPPSLKLDRLVQLHTKAKQIFKIIYIGTRICLITHQLDIEDTEEAAEPSLLRANIVLQVMNALFPPYVLQYASELFNHSEIVWIRERIYVYLMTHKDIGISSTDREVFQTKLLALADLGGWAGHIRPSIAQYFDCIEEIRRMRPRPDQTGEASPTAAVARPLPPPTPKSILKAKKRSISVGDIQDSGPSTGPASLETTPTRPRGASTSAASSTSPSTSGIAASPSQLVAHPALRGMELNLAQLARQALALPAGQFADDDDQSQYSSNNSPEKFSHPQAAPVPSGHHDDTWPRPLELGDVPRSAAEDKEDSGAEASGAEVASGSLPGDQTARSAMGLLRSGLRSAENLFSRFKNLEKLQTSDRAGQGEPSDDKACSLSVRSTPKSVRFKGIEDILPSREGGSLAKMFSKKKTDIDPWEYTRAYEIDKVKATSEGRAPQLPPPDQQWKWKNHKDNREEFDFTIRPQTPTNVQGLEESSFAPPRLLADVARDRNRTPEEVQEFIHDLQKTVSEQMQDV